MSDKTSQTVALGWFDPKRMTDTYDLVKTYVGLDKPFDVGTSLHQRLPRQIDQDEGHSVHQLNLRVPLEAAGRSRRAISRVRARRLRTVALHRRTRLSYHSPFESVAAPQQSRVR